MLKRILKNRFKVLQDLALLLTPKDTKRLQGLLLFTIVASFIEVGGVTIIFPFMSIASNHNVIHSNIYYQYIYNLFHFTQDTSFIITFGIIVILIFLTKTTTTLLLQHVSFKTLYGIAHRLAYKIFNHSLSLEYIYYVRRNKNHSPHILAQTEHIAGLITSILQMISELMIITLLYIALMYVNWKVTVSMTIFFAINIIIIQKIINPKIKKLGSEREQNRFSITKFLATVFNNYKLLKLKSNHDSYSEQYQKLSIREQTIEQKRMFLNRLPKPILELNGFMIMVIMIIYAITKYGIDGMNYILPVVSLLMLVLYRMLPSVTRIMEANQALLFYTKIPNIINHEFMSKTEILNNEPLVFDHQICLQNISFAYKKGKPILNNINLTITKGDSVAFIGTSGSGKSTLIDILMGLYKQNNNSHELYQINGTILIDNQELVDNNLLTWRNKIGYIPQEIYLFDGSVAENVIMNNPFNEKQLIEALQQASIWNFLKEKEGIDTKVGDGGVMLSGGQKQRIGIARALYNNPEIIIMDEATSALDDATEAEIINELSNAAKDKTIIMIAHRLSSLKYCNKIFQLEHGIIKAEYNNITQVQNTIIE